MSSGMTDDPSIDVELGFELFDFQEDDVQKLAARRARLVNSDMGTGKTYEAIALDLIDRQHHEDGSPGVFKTLVVCPLSTVESTWAKHFDMLTDLRVKFIDPKNRPDFIKALSQDYEVYIVHWEALRLMPELKEVNWFHIVADEAHRAKNRKAQQTQALKKLRTYYKTAMSGTQVTNKPQDYWSILNWLYPDQWRSYWKYYKRYVDFEIIYPQGFHKITGPKNVEEFLGEIRPYMVRHMKKEQCCDHHPNGVMPDLPDKYYTDIDVDLLPVQRKAYNQMRDEMVAWVGEHEDTPLIASVVVAKLIRLQQFSVAYAEVLGDGSVRLSEPSSKLDRLMDMLVDNEDEPFVVFTQFSQLVGLLGKRLEDAGISHALYTGDTSPSDRAQYVSDFQAGKRRIFVGTIKAGGVGLDLYTASTVVFLDRGWSPAENIQAEDRLWRYGQQNAVQVIDIMARASVDRGRKQMLETKWSWIKQLLGDK